MPKHHPTQSAQAPARTDALFEAFSLARMRGELLASQTLLSGEHVAFAPATAYFHCVEGPPCLLRIAGARRTIELLDRDLVFLLHGDAHRIERNDGQTAPTGLTSGVFRVDSAYAGVITRALPQILHVPQLDRPPSSAPDSAEQWLSVTLAAMRLERDHPSLGSALMLSRLMDLLFVWAVRHWLMGTPGQKTSWIAALLDPVIGQALARMHAEPARDWTVDALARQMHQSRSAFSQRFVDLVGEPAIHYLARWRTHLAADLLASTNLRVSQIAQRVGYDSQTAFSRAFKRHLGVTPVDHRKASRRS